MLTQHLQKRCMECLLHPISHSDTGITGNHKLSRFRSNHSLQVQTIYRPSFPSCPLFSSCSVASKSVTDRPDLPRISRNAGLCRCARDRTPSQQKSSAIGRLKRIFKLIKGPFAAITVEQRMSMPARMPTLNSGSDTTSSGISPLEARWRWSLEVVEVVPTASIGDNAVSSRTSSSRRYCGSDFAVLQG
jgi:hypothetical protein